MKLNLYLFIFMIFICISYGQGTANTPKDPFLGELSNIDSAGVKIPFGLSYYCNFFLDDSDSKDSYHSDHYKDFNSSKNLSLSFYVDNYQLDYYNNPLGHGLSLMFRDAGRDNGSGFKIGFFRCEAWSKPIFTIGYESSGDLSRKVSFNWYHNYTVGYALSDFDDGTYINLRIGAILRIPVSFFSISLIGALNATSFEYRTKEEGNDWYNGSYINHIEYNVAPLHFMVKISTNLE